MSEKKYPEPTDDQRQEIALTFGLAVGAAGGLKSIVDILGTEALDDEHEAIHEARLGAIKALKLFMESADALSTLL